MEKEKRDFVIKRGVFGIGLSVAILMAVTIGFQVPGYLFKLQSFNFKTFLVSLVIFTPIFLIAGYFWGILVYKYSSKNRERF